MERMASRCPSVPDGLCLLPFGNGAERMLDNRNLNAHIFNWISTAIPAPTSIGHRLKAWFLPLFWYGNPERTGTERGCHPGRKRQHVPVENIFHDHRYFVDSRIEMVDTTGAIVLYRPGIGVAAGVYASLDEALKDVQPTTIFEPQLNFGLSQHTYSYWQSRLQLALEEPSPTQRRTGQANLEKRRS